MPISFFCPSLDSLRGWPDALVSTQAEKLPRMRPRRTIKILGWFWRPWASFWFLLAEPWLTRHFLSRRLVSRRLWCLKSLISSLPKPNDSPLRRQDILPAEFLLSKCFKAKPWGAKGFAFWLIHEIDTNHRGSIIDS